MFWHSLSSTANARMIQNVPSTVNMFTVFNSIISNTRLPPYPAGLDCKKVLTIYFFIIYLRKGLFNLDVVVALNCFRMLPIHSSIAK